jgi:hypothetical protein
MCNNNNLKDFVVHNGTAVISSPISMPELLWFSYYYLVEIEDFSVSMKTDYSSFKNIVTIVFKAGC